MDMSNKALVPIAIVEILKEHTNTDNFLKKSEIIKYLTTDYRFESGLGPRTISSHLEALKDAGLVESEETYQVDRDSTYNYGWRYASKIEDEQLLFLINVVSSFSFIDQSAREKLIDNIKAFGSKYCYKTISTIKKQPKLENAFFFKNLRALNSAIDNNKSVSFVYVEFDYFGEQKTSKKLIVNPYKVEVSSGYHYLLTVDSIDKIHSYRIDLIQNIIEGEAFVKNRRINLNPYVQENPEMIEGDIKPIELMINKDLISELYKTFPSNPKIERINDKIKVNLKTNINTMKKFIFSNWESVESITRPQELIDDIQTTIQLVHDKFTHTLNSNELSDKNTEEGIEIVYGHSVYCIESLSCKDITRSRGTVQIFAEHYINMINNYIEKYEMYSVFENIFDFKFSLEINDEEKYVAYTFDEIKNKLSTLNQNKSFSIELQYIGYVEGVINIKEPLPTYYFGEYAINNDTIKNQLSSDLIGNVEYEQIFGTSRFSEQEHYKFDMNGMASMIKYEYRDKKIF